ncbi:MAG: hypothetical protein INR73_07415 [Williamsia sp.]|nr:hypothetical protein [Williamsia sp.]
MTETRPIAEEVLDAATVALANGNKWMAYNDASLLLEGPDVSFFKTKDDAIEFIINNYGIQHQYELIRFNTVEDILRQIPNSVAGQESRAASKDQNHLDEDDFIEDVLDKMAQQQFDLYDLLQKTDIMKQENFNFLADNIKYAGFGEDLKSALEKAMYEGKPEFQLRFSTEFNQKPFEAILNFRKSETSDMYFFNNYRASMERNDGTKPEQTFYLNKGKGITAKEAFNLLDGRAVHKDLVTKEGQPYKAWLQLNPEEKEKNGNMKVEQIHEKYGYDLKQAVAKFPVAELKDTEKADKLMASLQKGNVQSVTLEKDGASHKMFMEADPRYKTVKLYDEHMKLITKEALSAYQSVGKEAASKAVKQEAGQDKKKEVAQKPEALKPEKKAGLLPKKREGTKKGLGMA